MIIKKVHISPLRETVNHSIFIYFWMNNENKKTIMNIRYLEFIGRKVRPVELALFIKWLLGIKREIITLKNGLKFFVDPISDFGLKLKKDGIYEKLMTEKIVEFLQEGDTFIDLGANEGYFSIIASKIVGETGHVYAFEPQERLWPIILKNSLLNESLNIQLIPFGTGEKKVDATLKLYPTLNTGSSTFSKNFNFDISFVKFRRFFQKKQHSKIIPLDNIKKQIRGKVKLIKIDIEGFEFEALKGGKDFFKLGLIENLLIEIHPSALEKLGQNEAKICAFLKDNRFVENKVSENLMVFFFKN